MLHWKLNAAKLNPNHNSKSMFLLNRQQSKRRKDIERRKRERKKLKPYIEMQLSTFFVQALSIYEFS